MKKILIICLLLSMSTALFSQEPVQETVTVIQAKRTIPPKFLLGLGFDLLFGTDTTTQSTSKSGDANTFTESNPKNDSYDAGIIGDFYVALGTRILRSLDIYGRLGVNYAFIHQNIELKTDGKNNFIWYNRFDFNIDANTRYTFPLGSFGGPYVGLGLGLAFNMSEDIQWFQYDKDSEKFESTTLRNNNKRAKVHGYTNFGLGFLFKTYDDTAFSLGYSMRFYFTSLFNEDGDKILKKSNGETAKIKFGNNQLLHGINLEFSTAF